MITKKNYADIVAHLNRYSEGGYIIWFDVLMAVQAITGRTIKPGDIEPILQKLVQMGAIDKMPITTEMIEKRIENGFDPATRYFLK